MSEQEINLRKYVVKNVLDDSIGKFEMINKMLNEAKNEEDLNRIFEFLKYAVSNINSNVDKIYTTNMGESIYNKKGKI